jgi:hypothetical protein
VLRFGADGRAPVTIGSAALFLVGIGGLAFSLTILWLSMRAVMGIGGACASGGPYVPAVECPDVVVALTPLSVFGLFIFGGLAAWGGSRLGGGWVGLILLAWPALFLSLGWNFLEFGLRPPGGEPGEIVWSWLFCGVVFALMGGIPLFIGIRGAVEVAGSHKAYAGGRVLVGRAGNLDRLRELGELRDSLERAAATRAGRAGSTTGSDVASRLERLARLRAAGDLTDAEFEAAKRATLQEDGT